MNKQSRSQFHMKSLQGFTLMELIIVIIILGVMAVGMGGFITLTTQTYVNVTERDELISTARFAVERLNREIRNVVPNSVRVKDNATGSLDATKQCIEFVPIKASTVYTQLSVAPIAASDKVSVIPNFVDNNQAYSCTDCNDKIVVYPLLATDVYQSTDVTPSKTFIIKNYIAPLNSTSMGTLTLDFGNVHFSEFSPTSRAYIFAGPVSYCVEAGVLNRYSGSNYGFNNAQVLPPHTNIPISTKSLMAENIFFDKDNLPFVIENASLQRNAVVQIKLNFTRDSEEVIFDNAIHITNVP